ncbi:MAG: hypothetical protein ABSB57_02435 [Dehalococcoidia bacterium]
MATRSGLCLAHDPGLETKRQQARRRGGQNKARIARLAKLIPPRLMGVYDILEEALGEVHRGELTPQQATAMAALAGAMVRVLMSGEVEQRVRALEEWQASSNGSRPK